MTDSTYFVKSTPFRVFIRSFQYFADILQMYIKKFDAEKIFFDNHAGFLT